MNESQVLLEIRMTSFEDKNVQAQIKKLAEDSNVRKNEFQNIMKNTCQTMKCSNNWKPL